MSNITGMDRLEELKIDIYRCIHCKACKFAYSGDPSRDGIGEYKGKQSTVLYEGMVDSCPAGIEYGWESFWNAGKMWIARAIMDGDLEFSESVRDVFMPCITCGLCAVQCENKVQTVDIIESLRAACKEAGVPMIDKHEYVDKLVKERNNPYGGEAKDRFKWARDAGLEKYIDKEGAEYAYYVGCTASYRQTNIAIATCKIFEQLGIDFTLVGDEVCCGSPFFRIGSVDTAQDLMRRNIDNFSKYDVIFFSCAGCYRTFFVDYPKWLGEDEELPFITKHAFELISEMIAIPQKKREYPDQIKDLKKKLDKDPDNRRLKAALNDLEEEYNQIKDLKGEIKFKPNKELKGKIVTYHDPCHTGRHFYLTFEQDIINESDNLMFDIRKLDDKVEKWFEKPRVILRKLEEDVGIKFEEMYRIKENSMCCGAGGGVRAGYPDFSLRTASLRCDEANAVEADILTTECPFCWRNLSDANELYDHELDVLGILEMISVYDLLEMVEEPSKEIIELNTKKQ